MPATALSRPKRPRRPTPTSTRSDCRRDPPPLVESLTMAPRSGRPYPLAARLVAAGCHFPDSRPGCDLLHALGANPTNGPVRLQQRPVAAVRTTRTSSSTEALSPFPRNSLRNSIAEQCASTWIHPITCADAGPPEQGAGSPEPESSGCSLRRTKDGSENTRSGRPAPHPAPGLPSPSRRPPLPPWQRLLDTR